MFTLDELIAAMDRASLRLYHFTDSRNLDSIRARGLLSTRRLRDQNIVMVTGGDNDSLGIDRHRGYDGYVRLSFCKKPPHGICRQPSRAHL